MKLRHGEMIVASAGAEDLLELEELYSEACGYFKFDKPMALCSPSDFLRGTKLPHEGVPENFELLTIRLNEMLIGYLMVYRDFPEKSYVDILSFYIGEPARGGGFGTMAARMICRYFYETGYASVRASMSLRSWGALRFWNRLGFDRIIELNAEGSISDGGNGSVSLERQFAGGIVPEISR